MNFCRRDQSQGRVLPPHQGLGPDHAAVGEVDLGLVVQTQLTALDSAPQSALQHHLLAHLVVQVLGEVAEAVAPRVLGAVHRRVGVLDQVVRAGAIARKQADADAGRDEHLLLAVAERRGELAQDALRHLAHDLRIDGVRDHDGELVTAQARHSVGVAQALREPSSDLFEQGVAGEMAERVVHHLEAVEIDEHQCHQAAVAARLADRLMQAVLHQDPVRQPGEHVVLRQIFGALLRVLALGHVARSQHDAVYAGVIHEVVAERLEMDPVTLGVSEAKLDSGYRPLAMEQIAEGCPRPRNVLGVNRIEWVAPDQRTGRVAEHARCRGRFVEREALRVVHRDDVVRVLHECPEGFVVCMQRIVATPGQRPTVGTRSAPIRL